MSRITICLALAAVFSSAKNVMAAPPNPMEALNVTPLGYWRLGEPIGATTANDASGGGHHGTYMGNVTLGIPGALPADPDTAVHFDGTTSVVNVGVQPTFNLPKNFSLEAWIKPDSYEGYQRIVSNFSDAGGPTGYGFGLIGNRLIFSTFGRTDNIANLTIVTSQNWHQVAVTFDAFNSAVFYLDGLPTQSVAGGGSAVVGNGAFAIGALSPQDFRGQGFHGGIDEVAIYPGMLTPAQIQQQYAASRPWSSQVVKVLNTGVSNQSQSKLSEGKPDTDYVIGPGGTGGHIGEISAAVATSISPFWLADNASDASRWIALAGDPPGGHDAHGVSPGTYFFDTTVDLTGYQYETAAIQNLRVSADNALASIVINNHQVFVKPDTFLGEYDQWQYFGSVGLGYFSPGLNTIRFEVVNQPPVNNNMGLRLEGTVMAASVPEPSAIVLALLALGGLPLMKWRRRGGG